MATIMESAALDLVAIDAPGAQRVAVLRAPEPGEIPVRIKWVGICGSDAETFRGCRSPEFLTTPTRLGHKVLFDPFEQPNDMLPINSGLPK